MQQKHRGEVEIQVYSVLTPMLDGVGGPRHAPTVLPMGGVWVAHRAGMNGFW